MRGRSLPMSEVVATSLRLACMAADADVVSSVLVWPAAIVAVGSPSGKMCVIGSKTGSGAL